VLKSWFFTATDTGIGKTTVAAATAYLMRNDGVNVGVMKPFATGAEQKHKYKSEDVILLAEAAGVSDPQDVINPYFFPIPASPYTAANSLNAAIDTSVVLKQFEAILTLHDVVLVEGIGGILTPILKDYHVVDLIKDMGLDTILVISSKLGTVNHTLLTCLAAKKYGVNLRGIVIVEAKDGYNLSELEQDITNLTGVDVLCVIPYIDDIKVSKVSEYIKTSKLMELLTCLS
jgi:dethiobiotin synthetase